MQMIPPSRKHLTAIVMSIHPDRYHNESKLIQSSNLKCLQTINEIWDVIETHEEKISIITDLYNSNSLIDITMTLKQSYNLFCYIRNESNTTTNKDIECIVDKVEISLKIPSLLVARQNNVPIQNLSTALFEIYKQMGVFATILNLENPWQEFIDKNPSKVSISTNKSSSYDTLMENLDFQQQIFERSLKYNKYRQIREFNEFTGRKGKESRKLRQTRELLAKEVVFYLTTGNVKLRNITALDDFLIVNKFQDFLVEYGPYVNFQLDNWKSVVVIIHGDDHIKKNIQLLNHSTIPAIMNKYHAKKWLKYSFEVIQNKNILEIPKDFKPKDLSEFILDHISFATDELFGNDF